MVLYGNIIWVSINDISSCGKYLSDSERKITEKGLKNSSEGDWIIPDTEDENVKEIELLVISQGGKLIKMNPRIFFS